LINWQIKKTKISHVLEGCSRISKKLT